MAIALDSQLAQKLPNDLALDLALERAFGLALSLVKHPDIKQILNFSFSLEFESNLLISLDIKQALNDLKQELPTPLIMLKVKNKSQFYFLSSAIAISIFVLFISSSLRHALFQSSFDLAIFDNAVYLISQGQEPWVSFRGLHILGDHAAWILYPIALLYKIYPDIHWLFLLQALSLALGILPMWYLAKVARANAS